MVLRSEALAELTGGELRAVVGGEDTSRCASRDCPIAALTCFLSTASRSTSRNCPAVSADFPRGRRPGEIVGGVGDGLRDTYDALDTLVTNPTEVQRALEQVYIEHGRGLSGATAVFNQFNPVYHVIDRGYAYDEARKRGDLREAVRQSTHIGLTVVPAVGPARATITGQTQHHREATA